MAVTVTYRGVRFAADAIPAQTLDVMARDASWGTYVAHLQAIERLCDGDAPKRWLGLQPEFVQTQDGWPPEQFSLRFPDSAFSLEREGLDHLIGVIAGDIVRSRDFQSIEVDDIQFEGPGYASLLPGPTVGVDGLYDSLLKESLGGIARPLLAFSVKPRRGLSVEELARIYEEAAVGGADIVEDDERLLDPEDCPFEDRVRRLAKLQEAHSCVYSPNITGNPDIALERLALCTEVGIRMVKMDVLVSGFESLRRITSRIREQGATIAITAYPDAYGAYRHLTRRMVLKLSRLSGADIIYAGSPMWARYESAEAGAPRDAIEPVFLRHRLLYEPLPDLPSVRPTLATVTNDQHPSRAEVVTLAFRRYKQHHRFGFFVGGGIAGYPGTLRHAVETWRRCLEHASTADLETYTRYDFGTDDAPLREMGWVPLDVAPVLR